MVIFHRLVEVVGPGVFEGKDVKEHRFFAVDDFLGVVGEFGLGFIKDEGAGAKGYCSGVRHSRGVWIVIYLMKRVAGVAVNVGYIEGYS